MKTVRTYSLEWLDSLVSVTLNPEKPYLEKLQSGDIKELLEKVPLESVQVQSELISKIFNLNKDSQVRHMVRKYHQALTSLLKQIREYQELPRYNGVQLSALAKIIATSLEDLLGFIEKRFSYFMPAGIPGSNPAVDDNSPVRKDRQPDHKQKILCTLSGDQIALIIRGADEAQVIKARSMNAVFKAIVPFLSTEHKENLSADSVRSKAYNPEEADRDAAISALHAIIRKIQSY